MERRLRERADQHVERFERLAYWKCRQRLSVAHEGAATGFVAAALDAGRNLSLYIDGRADHLRLMDGPDRIPLNYEA